MSDTPRTDEIHSQINRANGSSSAAFHDMLLHARELERELEAARQEAAMRLHDTIELRDQLDALKRKVAALDRDRVLLDCMESDKIILSVTVNGRWWADKGEQSSPLCSTPREALEALLEVIGDE